jgi:hypothetical protein
MRSWAKRIGWVAVLPILGAPPAIATDGVIEINQAKAVAGNVTVMDPPGFPVVLNSPGSYRLTGNLSLSDAGAGATAGGIVINADNISIDLNGFTIYGVPMGSGVGISGGAWVTVTNGFLIFFGGGGIDISNGFVDHVVVIQCGATGIKLGNGLVSNSVVQSAGVDGIWVLNGSIENCKASDSFTGASFRLGTGVLRGSTSTGGNTDELFCDGNCAYGQNFLTCNTDADCFGGAGIRLQVPPLSNMCGSVVCN